jgi:hypothetical protein
VYILHHGVGQNNCKKRVNGTDVTIYVLVKIKSFIWLYTITLFSASFLFMYTELKYEDTIHHWKRCTYYEHYYNLNMNKKSKIE